MTPYYNKPPAEGLARHFAAIATAAAGLPVIIYNIPQRVILNLEPDLLVRLAHESENVVAVKQATTDLDQARAILAAGLVLYAGNDDLLAPFLELGGAGGICVASHLVGSEMLRMCDLAGVRRLRRRPRARSRADVRLRRALHHDQSHPAQGGARAHRAPRGRPPASAGRGDR